MIINTEGIVLRQRKIANNRRMIVLFTKQYGKLSAGTSINERSRSRAALALRPFTYADYDIFKGRETYSINSAQVKKSYYSIGEDIDRFMSASVFIEYLDKVLGEGEPMPKLFDLCIEYLESASQVKANSDTLLYAFIVKTLRMLGVAPELECCTGCGRPVSELGGGFRMFSVSSGGVICKDCAEQEKTSGNALIYKPDFDILSVIRYFYTKPLRTFEKAGLRAEVSTEVRNVLADYIDRWLGVDVLRKTMGLEVN